MKFGGSGITEEVFKWISDNIPHGKTIIEIGAGEVSTKYLSEIYNLYSIENNASFCGLWRSTYIHAPLVNGWYDVNILKEQLPKDYELILIDGPTGEGNRIGFANNLELFNTNIPLIFDDTNRQGEQFLVDQVLKKINKEKKVFETFTVLI